jgi:hypothetical protein
MAGRVEALVRPVMIELVNKLQDWYGSGRVTVLAADAEQFRVVLKSLIGWWKQSKQALRKKYLHHSRFEPDLS